MNQFLKSQILRIFSAIDRKQPESIAFQKHSSILTQIHCQFFPEMRKNCVKWIISKPESVNWKQPELTRTSDYESYSQ